MLLFCFFLFLFSFFYFLFFYCFWPKKEKVAVFKKKVELGCIKREREREPIAVSHA